MRQTPALLVLALIAFTNVYFQGGGASPAPRAAVEQASNKADKHPLSKTGSQEEKPCDSDVQRAFDELFGPLPDPKTFSLSEQAKNHHVRFLIGVVPDPNHTHLALEFDRLVEGIQQAAVEEGYTFQSVNKDLPWSVHQRNDSSDEIEISGARGTMLQGYGLVQIGKAESSPNCPGLLTFRKHSKAIDPESYLMMLLVGEKPTAGVDTNQFLSALHTVRNSEPEGGVIGILGPNYSGSYSSLDRLLSGGGKVPCLPNAVVDPAKEYFVIRSSSTMSGEEINWFRARNYCRASLVSFFDTVEYEQDKVVNFLTEEGFDPEHIAILSEDETAYGNLTPKHVKAGEGKACEVKTGDVKASEEVKAVKVYFPRGIATLRAAYQEDASLVADPEASRAPRTTLKTDFSTSGEDQDTVPTFDTKHTPLSQEAVLQEIVRTLRQHQVNFVIIRATDVIDTLFLAGQLRKSYPAGRLIALEADLLARRDTDDPALRGMLAVSNYPPFQGWVDEEPKIQKDVHRIFADSVQEGQFNAALDLIEETRILSANASQDVRSQYMSESGPKQLPRASYAGFMAPSLDRVARDNVPEESRPPLWLSVVGRDGYWPLTLLRREEPVDKLEDFDPCGTSVGSLQEGFAGGPKPAEGLNGPRTSETRYRGLRLQRTSVPVPLIKRNLPLPKLTLHNFHVLNVLVIFLLMAITAVFVHSTWWGNVLNTGSEADQYLGPLKDPRRTRLLVVGTAVLMVAWFLALMSWVVLVPWVIVGTLVFYNVRTLHRELTREMLAWLTGAAGATVALYFLARPKGPEMRFMFLYRSDNFPSGLSPNLPLLLICGGLLWWLWYLLKARSWFDIRRSLLPRGDGVTQIPNHDRYGSAGSARTLLCTRNFVILAVASVLVLAFQKLRLHSLEGTNLDFVYNVALCLGLVLLLNSLYGAWVYWKRCRDLLIALNRTPLRYSFMEISGFEWRRVWGLAGADSSFAYRPLIRAWESLQRLHRSVDAPRQAYLAKAEVRLRDEVRLLTQQSEPLRRTLWSVETRQPSSSENLLARLRNRFQEWAGRAKRQLDFNQQFSRGIESFQFQLSILATMVYRCVLEEYWRNDARWVTRNPKKAKTSAAKDNKAGEETPSSKPVPPAVQWAEEFVTLVYISFIIRVLIRIRWLGMTAIGLYVFLLLAATVYPFEPKGTIHAFFVFVFLAMLGVIGLIYGQMHRDDTLSHLTDTEPGQLGTDYWLRMASFAGVPLFTLVTTQVPQLSRTLFFWVKPLLDGIGRG